MQLGTHTPGPPGPLEPAGGVRLWDEHVPQDPAQVRAQIGRMEAALRQHPDAVHGDSDQFPLTHSFAEGCYVRQIFLPKGAVLTGKIHKHAHPNFLMSGEVLVVTEHGGREHLTAPRAMISQPGTKRAIVALADTVWITVHVTNATDLAKIEAEVIAPDYGALALCQAAPLALEEPL